MTSPPRLHPRPADPRPSGAPPPWRRFVPGPVDAVLLAVLCYLEVAARRGGVPGAGRYALPDPRWLGVALVAGQLAPLAWRRRAPLTVHLVVLAGWLSYAWLDRVDAVTLLVPLLTLHAVAARRRPLVSLAALAATVLLPAALLAAATAAGRSTEQPLAGDLAGFAVAFAAVWAVGTVVRWRRRRPVRW